MLILILSVTVGAIGCFVTWTVEMLLETKLHTVEHFIEHHHHSSDAVRYGGAFGVLLGFNLLFALCAFLLVWTEPWSAGSGIPEMKCVLNGVNIPEVLAPRTIVCKVLGVIFGVSAGLPVGKEGPMIHAGGAVGAILTSMGRKSKSGSVLANFKQFDNDRDRRDFASIGTAAGVSAAFRTPIGGVLFVIEEGASFWSTLMTWRGFAASVLAVATVYLVFHGRNMFTDPLEAEDLFLFGEFTADIDREFHIYELAYFSFMAVMGGLVGAIFIHLNTALAEWRRQRLNGNPLLRGIEVFLVTALMTGLSFGVPYYLGRCLDLPTDTSEWSEAGVHSVEYLKPLNCDAETQYNDLATLFLNEPDRTIRLLFHVGDDVISSSACFIFATVFLAMECLTFGIWACSGLFIPSLLAGAAFGRGIGQVFGRNARTYSLVGAGCVLGGIARMTISITVILVEASGYVLFVIPLMCVFLLSRVVGNRFNRGVYDTQIEAKHLPFLEEEPPEETRVHNLRVSQLMSKSIKCVKPVETVKAIHELLTNTTHNCFPVLDADHGILLGTIMRKNLLVLLSKRHFAPPEEGNARMPQSLPVLRYSKLEESYPNYPPVESMHLTDEDMDKLCDLTAYVQIGPHVISEHASAQRAYMMFRTLGLRHLPVVNHFNEAVGIITRDNLLPEFFKEGGAYDPVHAKALAMPSN